MTSERDSLGFDAPAPLEHPARAGLTEGAYTGPAVGERLPDFELPDAFGRPIRFHADRGESKAALVFYRSAVWWPPCWTQLGELRDSHAKFEAEGIKLYAVSYDDQEALREFSEAQGIPYPLLSDTDSAVIRQYRILNTEVSKDDLFLYGIPFPGVYVCDEAGIVISKFFHDSYKKRESPEALIDAALGRIQIDEDAPQASGGEEDIQITAAVRGGKGSIRQGIIRHLVVHFSLADGLHIYGEPVPKGLTATSVTVHGPEGLQTLPAEYPPTEPLHLAALGVDLEVWSGEVDIVIPFYPTGELASETRPLDMDQITVDVEVRYQACNDQECLLPRTERLTLEMPLDVIDVPNLPINKGHGQREGNYDSMPAMRRLLWRKVKEHPLSLPKFLWKNIRMLRAARRRRKNQG